jgi:hypothetical protein
MLIVDCIRTLLMPPYGVWRAVILHMETIQTNFQINLLPYSFGQHFPPKTWHLPVKSTQRHVPVDSNFHTHRCKDIKFDNTQSVSLIYHEHFPSSAFHRKKQYSIIVKFLFVCRFVFYVNVNNLLPEIRTCIYYVHIVCVFYSVLFVLFLITIYRIFRYITHT